MAEESFIACTKELEVLKRNASKIHRSISDHRLLSMDLLSANLISLPTLNKLNAPVSTPDAQSYELLNNLLQAVVCDPSNFHKLLGVLENHPPLLTAVAKEMKEDYGKKMQCLLVRQPDEIFLHYRSGSRIAHAQKPRDTSCTLILSQVVKGQQ